MTAMTRLTPWLLSVVLLTGCSVSHGLIGPLAMVVTGHKTVAVFHRYAIVSEAEQVDVAQRLQARAIGR